MSLLTLLLLTVSIPHPQEKVGLGLLSVLYLSFSHRLLYVDYLQTFPYLIFLVDFTHTLSLHVYIYLAKFFCAPIWASELVGQALCPGCFSPCGTDRLLAYWEFPFKWDLGGRVWYLKTSGRRVKKIHLSVMEQMLWCSCSSELWRK